MRNYVETISQGERHTAKIISELIERQWNNSYDQIDERAYPETDIKL